MSTVNAMARPDRVKKIHLKPFCHCIWCLFELSWLYYGCFCGFWQNVDKRSKVEFMIRSNVAKVYCWHHLVVMEH